MHKFLLRISSNFFLGKAGRVLERNDQGFFFRFNRWLENTEGCSKLNTVHMYSRIKITLLIIMTIVVVTSIIL